MPKYQSTIPKMSKKESIRNDNKEFTPNGLHLQPKKSLHPCPPYGLAKEES